VTRPPFEVADIVRAAGKSFIDRNRSRLTGRHLKVLAAIERCRTAALGGHRDRCVRCGYETTSYSYNSCRNRHCGKCQTNARDQWLAARSRELLPVAYVHVVFTLPHQLSRLVYHNQRILYDLLFRASAATLLKIAADPKHLGAEIGFLSVLHTWGQTLEFHPHVHCVIPSGGLSPDHQEWLRPRYPFFLPVHALGAVFRGKFVAGLKRAWRKGALCLPGDLRPLAHEKLFRAFLRSLHLQKWVVYAKPPFGGPQHVLHYLARYTHRVAISNHRIVNFADGKVTFRWKDYAHGNQKRLMTLPAEEFLRRFLLHALPRGFVRIRSFGFLANRRRNTLLPLCRSLLNAPSPEMPPEADGKPALWRCPQCGGPMAVVERLSTQQLQWALSKSEAILDSS
jgi:putative transposase/transposase-like zinc-binding protein